MTKLRDYQQEAIDDLRYSMKRGHKAPILVAPCGAWHIVFTYAWREAMNPADRFWNKVRCDPDTGCWVWTGALQGKYYKLPNGGYGSVRWKGRVRPAHRVAWELLRGTIPEGMQLDHLCRNTRCVNPDHLEPVTNSENQRRGIGNRQKEKTHCPQGHEYNDENTYIRDDHTRGSRYRVCRKCERLREQKRRGNRTA